MLQVYRITKMTKFLLKMTRNNNCYSKYIDIFLENIIINNIYININFLIPQIKQPLKY